MNQEQCGAYLRRQSWRKLLVKLLSLGTLALDCDTHHRRRLARRSLLVTATHRSSGTHLGTQLSSHSLKGVGLRLLRRTRRRRCIQLVISRHLPLGAFPTTATSTSEGHRPLPATSPGTLASHPHSRKKIKKRRRKQGERLPPTNRRRWQPATIPPTKMVREEKRNC